MSTEAEIKEIIKSKHKCHCYWSTGECALTCVLYVCIIKRLSWLRTKLNQIELNIVNWFEWYKYPEPFHSIIEIFKRKYFHFNIKPQASLHVYTRINSIRMSKQEFIEEQCGRVEVRLNQTNQMKNSQNIEMLLCGKFIASFLCANRHQNGVPY